MDISQKHWIDGLFKVSRKWDPHISNCPYVAVKNLMTGEVAKGLLDDMDKPNCFSIITYQLMNKLEPHWMKIASLRDIELNPCPNCGNHEPVRRLANFDKYRVICEIHCDTCYEEGINTRAVSLDGCPEGTAAMWNDLGMLTDNSEEQDLIIE